MSLLEAGPRNGRGHAQHYYAIMREARGGQSPGSVEVWRYGLFGPFVRSPPKEPCRGPCSSASSYSQFQAQLEDLEMLNITQSPNGHLNYLPGARWNEDRCQGQNYDVLALPFVSATVYWLRTFRIRYTYRVQNVVAVDQWIVHAYNKHVHLDIDHTSPGRDQVQLAC
jgi:hypothetical protein